MEQEASQLPKVHYHKKKIGYRKKDRMIVRSSRFSVRLCFPNARFAFFFFRISGTIHSLLRLLFINSSRKYLTFFVNSAHRALFTDPQILFFSHFFIKNGSHGTIHTFKNYFAMVFFSFQFSTVSKRTLIVCGSQLHLSVFPTCGSQLKSS